MKKTETDLDELEALQREAAALRSESEQTDSTAAPTDGQGSAASVEATSQEEGTAKPARPGKRTTRRRARSTGSATSRKNTGAADSQTEAEPPAATASLEEATRESAKTLEDLNVDFNGILKNMEDAARERPVLALLAAFSLGIVVGQMFSRK
ncbi:MAG: hypothetical protein HKP12_04185 [Gammaproteobacteria bacterium]|nr:hypothetical protein [Gammaproteobacteria bacterium]